MTRTRLLVRSSLALALSLGGCNQGTESNGQGGDGWIEVDAARLPAPTDLAGAPRDDFAASSSLSCSPGTGDCDGDVATGCETNLTTSSQHCGRCGYACAAGASCLVGACELVTPTAIDYGMVGLVVDASDLYYVTADSAIPSHAALHRVPKGGGAKVDLSAYTADYDTGGTDPVSGWMTSDTTHVYSDRRFNTGQGGGVLRWAKAGGAPDVIGAGHDIRALASDDTALYWVQIDGTAPLASSLWKFPLPSGPAVRLDATKDWYAQSTHPFAFSLYNATLYGGVNGSTFVRTVTTSDTDHQDLFMAGSLGFTSIFVHPSGIYYQTQDGLGNDPTFWRANLDGTSAAVLPGAPFPIGAVLSAGSSLYYLSGVVGSSSTDATLVRLPAAGGAWDALSTRVIGLGLALDDNSVYFASHDAFGVQPRLCRASR